MAAGRSLKVLAGSRHITLKGRDLDAYRGERGKRGGRLPRGFQRVDGLEVVD
jgi:topoisomerase-4 subunit A